MAVIWVWAHEVILLSKKKPKKTSKTNDSDIASIFLGCVQWQLMFFTSLTVLLCWWDRGCRNKYDWRFIKTNFLGCSRGQSVHETVPKG